MKHVDTTKPLYRTLTYGYHVIRECCQPGPTGRSMTSLLPRSPRGTPGCRTPDPTGQRVRTAQVHLQGGHRGGHSRDEPLPGEGRRSETTGPRDRPAHGSGRDRLRRDGCAGAGVAMAGPDLAGCDDGLELAREGGSDATTHLSRRGTALIREAPTLNHRAPPSGRRAHRHSFWVALLSSRPRQARTPADPFTAARDYSPSHSRQRQREWLTAHQ